MTTSEPLTLPEIPLGTPPEISAEQLEHIAKLVADHLYGAAWLSSDQVCTWLQIRRDYLYDLVAKNEVPHVKLGRLLRFKRAELDTWIEGYRQ